METSVSLHMEISNWIRFFVEIYTRQKNARIFGKKHFAFMEFAVNFSTQNAQSGQASRIPASIWRKRRPAILTSLHNRDF